MMRVLIVKTSSLGDLIHTFPAIEDAKKAMPDIRFDWVVEKGFAEVPLWHSTVERVIPIDLRRWRGDWLQTIKQGAIGAFKEDLRRSEYDLVIDAQGLFIKSALPAFWAKGSVTGYDAKSARDKWASLLYQQRYKVSRELHAVTRMRELFSQALGYSFDVEMIDYGLNIDVAEPKKQIVLMHATTWSSKHWPEVYWAELAHLIKQQGLAPVFPWHSADERLCAERIIASADAGTLLPRLTLNDMAVELARSAGVVGVDSGLAHIAAAVNTPAVTLYGPTRIELTGAMGEKQMNLKSEFNCAPCMKRECAFEAHSVVKPACFTELTPSRTFEILQQQMELN